MSDLHDIWQELFGALPSPAEEMVMANLARILDPDDPTFLICAVVIRLLTNSLLLDPSSPVNLAGRLGKNLRELNDRVERLDELFVHFDGQLYVLHRNAFKVQKTLDDAKKFAEKKSKVSPPVLKDTYRGFPEWEHSLAPNALRKIGWTVFMATVVGMIFATVSLSVLQRFF